MLSGPTLKSLCPTCLQYQGWLKQPSISKAQPRASPSTHPALQEPCLLPEQHASHRRSQNALARLQGDKHSQSRARRAGVRRSTARRRWQFTAFVQARPWAQLQLSARNQDTHHSPVGTLSWPAGTQGRPHRSLQGCGHPYYSSRSYTEQAG